jgi:hypothetical protein
MMNVPNYLKTTDAIVGEKARVLYTIWKERVGDRLAPKRGDITLASVRAVMPWLWMADVVEAGADFRFRLTGDRVTQFLGPTTGAHLSRLPDSEFRRRLNQTLAYCVQYKRPATFGPLPSGHSGKEHWEVEVFAAPLSEDNEAITCLVGSLEVWPLGSRPESGSGNSLL